jgi:D-glycero-alpha-D-manno-heptose-7-phosphate kinase
MLQFVGEAEAIVQSTTSSLDEFGRLLHENWKIKRKLTNKITNPEIDEIYEAGLSAGALGGKLLGAGAGGFMLFYVRPEHREALRNRLKKLLCVPFSFSNKGSNIVVYEQEKVYDKALASRRGELYSPEDAGVVRTLG